MKHGCQGLKFRSTDTSITKHPIRLGPTATGFHNFLHTFMVYTYHNCSDLFDVFLPLLDYKLHNNRDHSFLIHNYVPECSTAPGTQCDLGNPLPSFPPTCPLSLTGICSLMPMGNMNK